MPGFCRDCFAEAREAHSRCAACGSPRLLRHAQLNALSIAHVDCDAFYATIEKRDDPALADKPLIIGGGKRGVVSTACYIARTFGVRVSRIALYKFLKKYGLDDLSGAASASTAPSDTTQPPETLAAAEPIPPSPDPRPPPPPGDAVR